MRAEIKKIVHGGYGLAFAEDKTVFIPYTAPGDTVEFSALREKKNLIFGRLDSVVEPSSMRRDPECPVFGACGGCHLQHLSYEDEIKIKRESILEDLERIGKITIDFARVIPSPERYGYRNHAIFKVDAERRPGFLRRESDTLVPFPAQGCLLLPEAMRTGIAAVPPEGFEPLTEVRVRMDRDGGVHFWGLLDRVGPPEVLMEAGGLMFPVDRDAFFQVNRHLGSTLIDLVLSLPRTVRRRLLDLYCGAGFFTLPLAKMAQEALGIERDQVAVRNAVAAARLNAVAHVKFRRGDAEREIGRLGGFDLVLVDPPRLGLPRAVLQGIIRMKPEEIIFISCDPPTFARDAKTLIEAGYLPSEVNLIDLFPATYHAEIVSVFRRG
jgi:23S rRNA (uracil1939-C5)-methyltransferase